MSARSYDVLVIGSGASGLAAAVSAERAGARVALATKGSLQSCNSAKAQGGIQAAVRRGRLARAPRRGRLALVARDGRPAARRDPHRRGAEARSTGSRSSASSSRARTAATGWRAAAARPGSACSRSATGPATRSRPRCATAVEASTRRDASRSRRCSSSSRAETAGARAAADVEVDAATVVLAAGGRCYREAEERGELSTNHPGATGEVTQIALDLGAEARDLDALQYHPNGGAWPPNMQGYSIPETTRAYGAVLVNADGEEFTDSLGPRDAVSQAIFDEVEKGKGVETPDGRPGGLPRHDADRPSRRRDLAPVHAAPLPRRGHRPAARSRSSPTLSSTTRTAVSSSTPTARRRSRASSPAARSPAARTGGTG